MKVIKDLLFQIYDLGSQQEECDLIYFCEKIAKAYAKELIPNSTSNPADFIYSDVGQIEPSDYTKIEKNCKGCYGPCGQCEQTEPSGNRIEAGHKVDDILEEFHQKEYDLIEVRKRILNIIEAEPKQSNWVSVELLKHWEEFKKMYSWESDAVDVELVLMEQFVEIKNSQPLPAPPKQD